MKKQFFLKNEQKLLSFNLRIIGISGLIVFALLLQNVVSAQTTSGDSWSTTSVHADQVSQTTNFTSNEQVKAFMVQEEAKPLPVDYEIPEYITSGQNVDDAFSELKERYPEFFDLGKTQIIDVIKSNPARYTKMLNEDKAIKKYNDLSSKF